MLNVAPPPGVTHLCLNQEVPLRPHVFQETHHVDRPLILDLLQHAVYDDVGPRPSHTGAAGHRSHGRALTPVPEALT